MNFDAPGIVRSHLTILVVDLRNSSAFFRHLRLSQVEAFIDEFGAVITEALNDVLGYIPDQVRIVKFTGDGFLIVFAEPDDLLREPEFEVTRLARGVAAAPVLGPARALALAHRLRKLTQETFKAWNAFAVMRQGPADVGLVSGIADGAVSYGSVARPLAGHHDILGEPAVKAFRFAQIRDAALVGSEADRILVCDQTRAEVERFLDHALAATHSLVADGIRNVTFEDVELPEPLKGVTNLVCFQAIC